MSQLLNGNGSYSILFLGHSFGGLVIEQALVKARHAGNIYSRLIELLGGIVLFGTPHRGSPTQRWGQILANLAELIQIGDPTMMQDLDEKSMKVYKMIFAFMQLVIQIDLAKKDAIICFCENKKTSYARKAGLIVGLVGSIISTMVSGFHLLSSCPTHLSD